MTGIIPVQPLHAHRDAGLRSSGGINPSVYTALVKKELYDKLKTTSPEFVNLEFNSAEDKQNYTLRISENSDDIIPKETKRLPPTSSSYEAG